MYINSNQQSSLCVYTICKQTAIKTTCPGGVHTLLFLNHQISWHSIHNKVYNSQGLGFRIAIFCNMPQPSCIYVHCIIKTKVERLKIRILGPCTIYNWRVVSCHGLWPTPPHATTCNTAWCLYNHSLARAARVYNKADALGTCSRYIPYIHPPLSRTNF